MSRLLRRALPALFAIAFVLPAAAQTMIDKVPDSAAVYVGWRGAEDMGPAYEGSNMQGVLEATGLLEAVPELMRVMDQLGDEGQIEEEQAEIFELISPLLSSAWAEGGAMYMLPPDPQGPPIPRLCVMMKKGENPAPVRDALNTVVAILGEQMPTFTGEMDGALYLAVGFNPIEMEYQSLSRSARFRSAAKNVQSDAALMMYMDATAWVQQIDQLTQMMRDQADQQDIPADPFVQLWPTIKAASGLSGLESVAMSAGIKNKNWHTRLFVGAPVPRRGVLSLLDNEPITPATLMHVPKTATYVQGFSMQPSRILDITMDVAGSVDESIVKSIQEALNEASDEVGFDVELKLIRGMGPAWTLYIDPMIAGNGVASIVLVNELQDAKSVEQSMAQLSSKANVMMSQEDDVKIRFITRDIGGTAVTHLGIPFVSPAWAVHDNKLYVALFPQALELALEQSGERKDSILANPAFQTAMGRFLAQPGEQADAFSKLDPITGLSFADLPETASEGFSNTMMLMQIVTGMSEAFSGQASPVRVPPIGKLMPFLEVAGAVTRVDVDGLHVHSVEPFPGASTLSASKGMTAGAGISAPIAIGTLLPALGSARESARAAQTLAQVRQLGIANLAYAVDHEGNSADDIAKLAEYAGGPEAFFSPRAAVNPLPANFGGLPEAQQATFLRQNSSFVLVPVGNQAQIQDPSATIVLFERPDVTIDATEYAVAMADGSARMLGLDDLADMLEDQTDRSIIELTQQQADE